MSDWKNTEWQRKLKDKPLKYWNRDENEEIVNEENIHINRFKEYSKIKYDNIIKSFIMHLWIMKNILINQRK